MNNAIGFQFLNDFNFRYLCKGLTLDSNDMNVIDQALIKLNVQDNLVDQIVIQNQNNGLESTLEITGPQIIISCDKYQVSGKSLSTAIAMISKDSEDLPPMLHINMHSPTLNIPQRIEIPLRYLLNGAPPLDRTYMVYLHALEINHCKKFVYYGITKRGWMKRFNEHVKLAIKGQSQRKFPNLLGESMRSRINELLVNDVDSNSVKDRILTGSHHVVCAAGRTKRNALEIEKFLIDKRSLSVPEGLNMISGQDVNKGRKKMEN